MKNQTPQRVSAGLGRPRCGASHSPPHGTQGLGSPARLLSLGTVLFLLGTLRWLFVAAIIIGAVR